MKRKSTKTDQESNKKLKTVESHPSNVSSSSDSVSYSLTTNQRTMSTATLEDDRFRKAENLKAQFLSKLEVIKTQIQQLDFNLPQVLPLQIELLKRLEECEHDPLFKLAAQRESISAKLFTTLVYTSDLAEFEATIISEKKESEKNKYIENFIESHKQDGVLNQNDVYSLLLRTAISENHQNTVKHILNIPHNENILTNIDESDRSPLVTACYKNNEEIITLLREYIKNSSNNWNKTKLDEKDSGMIEGLLHNPPTNVVSEVVYELVRSLYSYESLRAHLTDISEYAFAELMGTPSEEYSGY